MKSKKKRVLETPPQIAFFIKKVTSAAYENIDESLKDFVWEYDKGDFHQWMDLFNYFDSFFEKYIKSRKDLQIEDNFLKVDPLFPRDAVLQILRVMRVILENCTNKHFYSSFEQHLSLLLASTDADIIEASLQTLTAFFKKTVGKCSIRDASLRSKLFAFSQGWGGKEDGLGLVACSLPDGCDPIACDIGSTLHFEFYSSCEASKNSCSTEDTSQGWQVIHLPIINSDNEDVLQIMQKLVMTYNTPSNLRFSLLTRLRFAKAFGPLTDRHQFIRIRLYAFILLVQASNNADDLATFFNNSPEFISELLSLLGYEDEIPEKIRILGILSLVALHQDRTYQPMVLSSVSAGGHRGTLPSLMQKAVDSITSGSSRFSIVFAEALLALISILVASTPGSLALQEAGFIPSILPLLKDTKPQHLHLVSTAVRVIEGFLDYHNPSLALFRDLGGLDNAIARLKVEVSDVERGVTETAEKTLSEKGKQIINSLSESEKHSLPSESFITHDRRSLIKALLRTISLATYVPGSSARVDGSEESILPTCLCIIFRRAKEFGGVVFSLAANVMSDLIHKDPTCFSVLAAADVPGAFLDAIDSGVPCSHEAVSCIPQCLDALCLNNTGLQLVKDRNALRCLVKIFTSTSYLKALNDQSLEILSNGLDELMRHSSVLRASGVDVLIDILNTISNIGSCSESSSTGSQSSLIYIPMEVDLEDNVSSSLAKGEMPETRNADQMNDSSVGSFLPECISNATRLLEPVLQNANTINFFIDKKGIEVLLKLFTMQVMPTSVSICQSISNAFKKCSAQNSTSLAKAVFSFIKEHLKLTNELLSSVSETKLVEVEHLRQAEVLKCLSSLVGLLSLSSFLLKGSSSMNSELGSADADVFKELSKVYKEIVWQISLCSDAPEVKRAANQEEGNVDASVPDISGRDSDDDGNIVPVVRYMNPFSMRSNFSARWRTERDLASIPHSSGTFHRHGRNSLSRARGGRIYRQLGASQTDSEGSTSILENSHIQDGKSRSSDILVPELLRKLGLAIRSFLGTVVKGLPGRRGDASSLSPPSKNLATAVANFFLDALSYPGHSTPGLELTLSVKCRYLGKVVEDMVAITVDRRRICNTAVVNSFYVNGTFKELLTTFEATSQLLWAVPFPIPASRPDEDNFIIEKAIEKESHRSWLLDTLQSYCCLLEYHVNSSLLLSSTASSDTQLLVHPVSSGLSIGLFPVPTDPEVFVRMLQSQVLDVILPIWNHPRFPNCSPSFIASVNSILTCIYFGVGDLKRGSNDITAGTGRRFISPPLDDSTISTIVEMGFTRARAEEALRNVGTNSVELATDWLFNHPEEIVQEDVQLAQALALSLGNTFESSKEDNTDLAINAYLENRQEVPPVDDILQVSAKLLKWSDGVIFSLTDLFLALCHRNKGEHCSRVVVFLIQQLKLCPSDFSKDTGALSSISHILALLLYEESSTREVAAQNGLISLVLDILSNFKPTNGSEHEASATKVASSSLLMVDSMVQCKPKIVSGTADGVGKSSSDLSGAGISLANSSATPDKSSTLADHEKKPTDVFEKSLGKSTGFLTLEESQKVVSIACYFIKQHVPEFLMRAALQISARLTKTHALASQFLESGALAALFNLPNSCMFPGFDSLVSVIVRHLIEDPQTLQTAMELEMRQTLTGHSGRFSPRLFLTSMAPLISRDSAVFTRAAAAVCQIESSGGRMNVVLKKEKEKDKDRLRISSEAALVSTESIRMTENRLHDLPSKCSRPHKRTPANITQVIDQLLEIILSHPSPNKPEEVCTSSTPMEIDEHVVKEKGKSKIGETLTVGNDNLSERSAWFSKVIFVLKLLTDILLMYTHAVGVILRRDAESIQLQGGGQLGVSGPSTVLHHILHHLLPLASESSNELNDKLSEKASWFLVVLCGRSAEGRRRVITEILKEFSFFINEEGNTSKSLLIPDKRILTLAELINSILSRNSSSNLPGTGCSPDIAKAMIDGGMMHSLSCFLQVIDLDHPNAPKVINLIVKALENLTRAANADQVLKLDGLAKKRLILPQGRTGDQTNAMTENANHDQNGNYDAVDASQNAVRVPYESSHSERDHNVNHDTSLEQNASINVEENQTINPPVQDGLDFMNEEMDEGAVTPNTNGVGLTFQVDHQNVDDTGDEDDEDVGEDVEDDDEDEEEEDAAEEGAALSLADTDVEDHDDNDNGINDEYTDHMIDGEDDDFPDNPVIEVRWRESLTSLEHFRALRRPVDANALIDITEHPFQGLDSEDLYHLHRPFGIERSRQSSNRTFELSRLDVAAFQHPLLARPSHSGELLTSLRSSNGNSSRNVHSSFAGFGSSHISIFDTTIPAEHVAAAAIFGDRLDGAVPSHLIDFSRGMDSSHISGRRGPGDSRWTDDGQPHVGSHASAIAQAFEDQFLTELCATESTDNPKAQEKSESENQVSQQSPILDVNIQASETTLAAQRTENQHQDPDPGSTTGNTTVHQMLDLPLEDYSRLIGSSHMMVDVQHTAIAEESQRLTEIRESIPDSQNVTDNNETKVETKVDEEGHVGPTIALMDAVPEVDLSSSSLPSMDHQVQNDIESFANPHDTEFRNQCGPVHSNMHTHSSSQALISFGSSMHEYSDAHAGSAPGSSDVHMNNVDAVQNQYYDSLPSSGGELSGAQMIQVAEQTTQADQVNDSNEASSTNAIDPTFLEALPEDLRAEVLASRQASRPTQGIQAANYGPPPMEEIDPEFLAALPPDIQAEVLVQQQVQRHAQVQQAEGQPVEMDNASIIATFPPELREEVLLTSPEAVLSRLPPALVAEAQMLRDRRSNNRFHYRNALFGGSHRLDGRRLAVNRQTVMDRGVGVTIGRRILYANPSTSKDKEVEGMPLLDANALKALIRLLRLAQPLSKGLLQRLLLNLCAHSVTRNILVGLLVDMIRIEADSPSQPINSTSQRLYGCRWDVVYGRPQHANGLPPFVSRRLLEILTYLAKNHLSVASALFYFNHSSTVESTDVDYSDNRMEKYKEKFSDMKAPLDIMDAPVNGFVPLILLLKLLDRPLFLRSNAHLELVMGLLQVVVSNAVSEIDSEPSFAQTAEFSETQLATGTPDGRSDNLTSAGNPSLDAKQRLSSEMPSLDLKHSVNRHEIFLQLPKSDLRNLCRILAQEGLSDKVYSLNAEVVKKLALVATLHRRFFAFELADLAHSLSSSAITELSALKSSKFLGLGTISMAGATILRVLQALSVLASIDCSKDANVDEEQSILWNLNSLLEPLWQALSDCISATEMQLGQTSSFSSALPSPSAGENGGSFFPTLPLPPAAQRLLPFIEAYFLLCEKLQTNQIIGQPDSNVTAREVKESAGSSLSPMHKCTGTSTITFARIVEKHRRLLNVFIRQNPTLLEKSLSLILKVPRLIDFDNKRAYFRSRIRKQHDQHFAVPLRISVRRAYVLEDSYNQLRLRSTQDLKGRLTVHFQGEEGIDAGGLTREWYQILSRVIFDKGALLFTTVGNNSTFQPNPNSVYQTEHLSYFRFVGRLVAKALFDGQLLDVYFTRSFYKHILGVKVTYHDIEAVDPDYYKNLKWMLENDVSDIPDLTFSMDADEEKHILYEKNQVTDYELIPGGRNIRVTEETKHEYVDLVAEHILTNAIRPQITSFLEGFNELVPKELVSIFNDKELELLLSGLPEIDLDDLQANTEYTGYSAASTVIQWFWEVVKSFNKEDMARLLQFVTGTSKVPLEGFKALQGISGPQRFQIHKSYGAPERLPSAHTCFNQLDLPEYSSKEQLQERLLLAIHEASEGFGFG